MLYLKVAHLTPLDQARRQEDLVRDSGQQNFGKLCSSKENPGPLFMLYRTGWGRIIFKHTKSWPSSSPIYWTVHRQWRWELSRSLMLFRQDLTFWWMLSHLHHPHFEISLPAPQSKTKGPRLHKLYLTCFRAQRTLVLELLLVLQERAEMPNCCARSRTNTQLGDRLDSQKKNNVLLVSVWLLCGINEPQPLGELTQLAQNLIADNEGNYQSLFCFPWQDRAKAKEYFLRRLYKPLRTIQTNGSALHWSLHFVIKHKRSYCFFKKSLNISFLLIVLFSLLI